MNDYIPTYTEKILSDFAIKEWLKARNFLKTHFGLSEEDCEDVFQEAFIILFNQNKDGKLKDLKSSLSTYFISICKNKAHELIRSKNYSLNVSEDVDLDILDPINEEKINTLLTFDQDAALIERKNALARQIVQDLPKPCKELLWGFFRDGLSLKTLSETLSKTVGYVKVTKHRCQEKFRRNYASKINNLLKQ